MTGTSNDVERHRPIILLGAVVAAVVLAGLLVTFLPSALSPHSSDAKDLVDAKVTRSVSCDSADPHDEVTYNGNAKIKVSSCGSSTGTAVRISLPTDGGDTAQIADTSARTNAAYRPIGFALLTLAGIAGVFYLWLFGRRRSTSLS